MKKAISSALCAALALQVMWLPQPASAAGISYTPVSGHTAGLLDGTATVSHVSNLQMTGAVAQFQGNSFSVSDGGTNPQLYGVILDPHLNTNGKRAKYQAVAFVQGGDALPRLAPTTSQETVVLADNTELNGTIASIDGSKLVMKTADGTKNVELSNVTSMSSPRLCDMTVIAQATAPVDPTKAFTADTGSAKLSMSQHHGCYPEVRRRKAARNAQPTTYTTTKTTTETKDVPAQVINAPAAPTTSQTITQPAVCDQVVTQRAVACPPVTTVCQNVAHNPWAWIIGAGLLATAIAVPIAVTHHHHHHNNPYAYWNQYYYLNARATP